MQPNLYHCICYCFSLSGVSLFRVGQLSWPNGYVPWCLHLGPPPSTQPCQSSSSLALGYSSWGRYMNLLLGIFPNSYVPKTRKHKKKKKKAELNPQNHFERCWSCFNFPPPSSASALPSSFLPASHATQTPSAFLLKNSLLRTLRPQQQQRSANSLSLPRHNIQYQAGNGYSSMRRPTSTSDMSMVREGENIDGRLVLQWIR